MPACFLARAPHSGRAIGQLRQAGRAGLFSLGAGRGQRAGKFAVLVLLLQADAQSRQFVFLLLRTLHFQFQ